MIPRAATSMTTDAATARTGRSHHLGLWFAHLYVLGICGTLAGAYFFQFALGEYPCSMCLQQRMFFLLSAIGPAYIIARAREGAVTTPQFATGWGWAILVAVLGGIESGSQTLMHIIPPDPGYAGTLFGLHLYTWALLVFIAAVIACAIVLILAPMSEPLDAGVNSPAFRKAASVTLTVLVLFAATNLFFCFLEQGFHWQMPGDPDGYEFFSDLGITD